MWGTPWLSRRMVTGAERPGMATAPSSWGSESDMDWRTQWRAVKRPTMTERMTSEERVMRMRKKMRRRWALSAASSGVRGASGTTSGLVRWGRLMA